MGAAMDLGMVGLGVMGRNFLLNLADHGHGVAGLDSDAGKVAALKAEGSGKKVDATTDQSAFLGMLRSPRAIILLVPAGKAVDDVLADLSPRLDQGDLVIDAGNSHFKDTERRGKEMAARGLNFFGMGVSGGEAGARRGPSLMPGGPREAYERVRKLLDDVSAKVDGEPCAAYLGPGAAGHYVKMVHNGIEYALMQVLAEAYDLAHRGLGLDGDALAEMFDGWNRRKLRSFLVEITAKIFRVNDPKTGKKLVDVISDVARQKGTGKWTSQEAMELQAPLLAVDAAVSLRDLSAWDRDRKAAEALYAEPRPAFTGDKAAMLASLENAVYVSFLMCYAQGFFMLRRASEVHGYGLDLETVARIWRGGCIVRAALLEPIRQAYRAEPALSSLLLAPSIVEEIKPRHADLRRVIRWSIDTGIAAPAMASTLTHFDAARTGRLPLNLTAAQRDFFGAHTYSRLDEPGTFHTQWE